MKDVATKREEKIRRSDEEKISLSFCINDAIDLYIRVEKAMTLETVDSCDLLILHSKDYDVREIAKWRKNELMKEEFAREMDEVYLQRAKQWVQR